MLSAVTKCAAEPRIISDTAKPEEVLTLKRHCDDRHTKQEAEVHLVVARTSQEWYVRSRSSRQAIRKHYTTRRQRAHVVVVAVESKIILSKKLSYSSSQQATQ